ncbi:hypothetical protein DRQ19_01300 [bacterium]|nr:MAG: hypothetical protein DRQ19_01300 [bacterium]
MSDERRRILNMLADGKLTVDEADRLIEVLGTASGEKKLKKKAKLLHIKVFEGGSEKPTVNVNLPLGLVKLLTKFGGKYLDRLPDEVREKLEKEDVSEIVSYLSEAGEIINVDDGKDIVKIYVD